MKKKIVIGEKLTRKSILAHLLLFSLYELLFVVGLFNVLRIYFHVSSSINYGLFIFIFILILIFLLPLSAANEKLEFTNDYISYYRINGYFHQLEEVLRVLKGYKEIPDMSIQTSSIKKVNLSYISVIAGHGQKGYKLKLTFLLSDGTVFYVFPASTGQMEKGDYEAAFQLLEDNHVEIVDKLGLRKYLNMSSYDFQKYIQSIEEGKEE